MNGTTIPPLGKSEKSVLLCHIQTDDILILLPFLHIKRKGKNTGNLQMAFTWECEVESLNRSFSRLGLFYFCGCITYHLKVLSV